MVYLICVMRVEVSWMSLDFRLTDISEIPGGMVVLGTEGRNEETYVWIRDQIYLFYLGMCGRMGGRP